MTSLKKTDPETKSIIDSEIQRQSDVLQLIPSENYTSRAVLEALGSEFTNKYSEGYPKKRYYQGNKFVDDVEILAQVRAKKIFGVPHANVQPYSGSPANTAVYLALLEPLKNKIMGLSLAFGGHLTHGSPVSISGKYFKAVPYELGRDGKLDFNAIEKIAKRERPKIIVCGFTAYPRAFEFEKFGEIAEHQRLFTGGYFTYCRISCHGSSRVSSCLRSHCYDYNSQNSARPSRSNINGDRKRF